MRTLHLKNVKYEHQENDKEKKKIKRKWQGQNHV